MAVFNRAGFLSLIQSLSGLQTASVVWARDPQPFVSPTDEAIVKCTLRALTPFKKDETRYNYEPTTGAFTEYVYGVREICITVRVEQFAYQIEASEILDLIKTSMQLVSVQGQILALGLSLRKIEASMAADYLVDNREVNMAQADFTFNVVSSVEYTQVNEGWIETVTYDGTVGYAHEVDLVVQAIGVMSMSVTWDHS